MPAEDLVSNHNVKVLVVRAAEGDSGDWTHFSRGQFWPIEDRNHPSLCIANLNPHERCHVKKPFAIHRHAGRATFRRFVGRFHAEKRLSVGE
jgi:hypothetical protein